MESCGRIKRVHFPSFPFLSNEVSFSSIIMTKKGAENWRESTGLEKNKRRLEKKKEKGRWRWIPIETVDLLTSIVWWLWWIETSLTFPLIPSPQEREIRLEVSHLHCITLSTTVHRNSFILHLLSSISILSHHQSILSSLPDASPSLLPSHTITPQKPDPSFLPLVHLLPSMPLNVYELP